MYTHMHHHEKQNFLFLSCLRSAFILLYFTEYLKSKLNVKYGSFKEFSNSHLPRFPWRAEIITLPILISPCDLQHLLV